MSKSITNLFLVGTMVLAAACTTRGTQSDVVEVTAQEFVVVQPEPMSVEPVYTGKFK